MMFGLLSATPYSVLYWRNKMMVMVIIVVVLHFHVPHFPELHSRRPRNSPRCLVASWAYSC